jgi:serine/threonine protein kinase
MGAVPSEGARGEPDPLTEWVDEFVRALDEGTPLDVEAFIATAPRDLRAELRARCRDVSFLRNVMPAPSDRASGGTLLGRVLGGFHVIERRRAGPSLSVYAARQISSQLPVELHVLDPQLCRVPSCAQRFLRAARAAEKPKQVGIAPIVAIGEQEGLYFFAVERVEGVTLARELELARTRGRHVAFGARDDASYVRRVGEIAAEIAEALECAHTHGVIHCGIEPENVALDRDGRPRLVALDLDDLVEPDMAVDHSPTSSEAHYTSPERVRSLDQARDHRADVFSLGALLYEMLTSVRPFEAATTQHILWRVVHDQPAPIRRSNRAVPRDLERICFKALQKRPGDRYASAGALAADLRRFLTHAEVAARPRSWLERAVRKLVGHA